MATKSLVLSFVVLGALLHASRAARYTVGDSDGWKPGVNYTSWAIKQKFYPGDYLVFNYPEGQDTILEVNRAGYESCASSNPINHHNDGNSVLRLTRPGTHYYISGTDDHCSRGQKFSILVISLSGGGAPSPAASTVDPAAAPMPLKSNTPPSTKNSSSSPLSNDAVSSSTIEFVLVATAALCLL